MTSKKCSNCKNIKPLSEFHKNKSQKDGHQHYCKVCRGDSVRRKKYRDANKDKIAKWRKNDYEKNKEKRLEYHSRYRKENKEKLKSYREKNKEKLKSYAKEYKTKNRSKINIKYNQRYDSDEMFKMQQLLRCRIRDVIKNKGSKSSIDILGCSWEQLYLHLNYNNLDKPSNDHIIPLSWAETEEELYALCHYTNLKGMEHIENTLKGNRKCLIKEAQYVLNNTIYKDVIEKVLNRKKKNKKYYINENISIT